MPLILGAQSATATGFSVDNSCRFNGSDEKMGKTLGTPTDLNKWTYSAWIKLGAVSTLGYIFECTTGASNFTAVKVDSTARLFFGNYNSGYLGQRDLTRLFRDPSAWYHFVAVWDSDNGVAADRMKLYVNGVHQTIYHGSTNPTSGEACQMASGADLWVAVHQSIHDYFSGYMAEVCFIDGLALTPSDFGEYDEDSPTVWKPIDVSGLTFGNNGFYLDFEDSANLGNDANGGTDLTETNLAAANQATDTPTNNFATLNPLNMPTSNKPVFSNGNNTVVTQNYSAKYFGGTSTLGMVAGKWYCECKASSLTSNGMVGINGYSGEQARQNSQVSYSTSGFGYNNVGEKCTNLTDTSYGDSYTTSNVIGIAVDLDNLKIYFAKDNVWQDSGDPTSGATGTGAAFTILAASATPAGFYAFSFTDQTTGSSTWDVNFGGCSGWALTSAESDENGYGNFEYAPPSGYLALCTKNLGSDGG